jgi:hypothetical protein
MLNEIFFFFFFSYINENSLPKIKGFWNLKLLLLISSWLLNFSSYTNLVESDIKSFKLLSLWHDFGHFKFLFVVLTYLISFSVSR